MNLDVIFLSDDLVVHKSFHRYVVRAKQGGLQSASDARGTKAKSSGASLRRLDFLASFLKCFSLSRSDILLEFLQNMVLQEIVVVYSIL